MDAMYELVGGNWSDTVAVAAAGRKLYAVDTDTHLYRVDPFTAEYEHSLDRGWHSRHVVGVGDRLLAFEPSGSVYRVGLADGYLEVLATGWRDVGAVAAVGNRVFAVASRALYSIDPDTGSHDVLDGSWDTRHLVGVGNHLFAWEADHRLYRVDPETGHSTVFGADTWPRITAAATACGALFAVDDTILYRIDPVTGAAESLGNRFHTRLLVGLFSCLYSFETAGRLVRVSVG
jgi:hypothetical protein